MMKRPRVLAGIAIIAAVVLVVFVATRSDDPSGPDVAKPARGSKSSQVSKSLPPSPGTDDPTPSSGSGNPAGSSPITIENLTMGEVSKAGSFTSRSTSPIAVPNDSLVLVHLMSCCDHADVPTVTGAGLVFDLAVTHTEGEKRHWVFVAANEKGPTTGPLTFTFSSGQDRILWTVESALNVELGSNGADAIVQTAWQNSQTNADHGAIALNAFEDAARNAAVVFALAGSGAATDIVPEDGMTETAEVETAGANLLIDTFWRGGEETSPSATFRDDAGQLAIQSWLFLALELRAAGSDR
jgi:hypothetical protein